MLTIVGLVLLVNAFLSLVIFYHSIMNVCTNIGGTIKLVMLKMSVGLIVVQGLVVQFINMDGTSGQTDDDVFTAEHKTLRIYYFAILVEYAALSLVYVFSYTSEMQPSERAATSVKQKGKDPMMKPDMSYGTFLYQSCFCFFDTLSGLSLGSPLTSAMNSSA